MPRKNTERIYIEDNYYHIYNRGLNKETVFRDVQDYAVFLNLFKRYLGDSPVTDKQGRQYPWLHNDLDLLAFCLMPNHFHALVHQRSAQGVPKLFGSLATAYGMYFNKKYSRIGPIFQSRFKASVINKDAYLEHITRYIHLNPDNYKHYEFSSLPYYLGHKSAEWIKPGVILDLFESRDDYAKFVSNYKEYKKSLDELKRQLAQA